MSETTGASRAMLDEWLRQAEDDVAEESQQWYGKFQAGWIEGARWAIDRLRADLDEGQS